MNIPIRKAYLILGLVLALGFLNRSTATAQTAPAPGYEPHRFHTVAWIQRHNDDLDADDRYVNLVGTVTRPTGEESYWFTDGTGYIRLDSARFELPVGRRIVVGGRIDQAFLGIGHLEVDVRRWYYAPANLPNP